MIEMLSLEGITQLGFPIAVTIYLLYERTKFNDVIAKDLIRVTDVLTEIKENMRLLQENMRLLQERMLFFHKD